MRDWPTARSPRRDRSRHTGGRCAAGLNARLLVRLEPRDNHRSEIRERQLLVVQVDGPTHSRQVSTKHIEPSRNDRSAWHCFWGVRRQPITHGFDSSDVLPTVSADVLATDVGAVPMVRVASALEDERDLLPLKPSTERPRPKKQPQLERHVKSRQSGPRVWFRERDVVYAELRLADESQNLLNPHFSTVNHFLCRAGDEAAVVDGEDEGVKEGPVGLVERAVDEDALGVRTTTQSRSARPTLRGAYRSDDDVSRRGGDLCSAYRRRTDGVLDHAMLKGVAVRRGHSAISPMNRYFHAAASGGAAASVDRFGLCPMRRGRRRLPGLSDLPAPCGAGHVNRLLRHGLLPCFTSNPAMKSNLPAGARSRLSVYTRRTGGAFGHSEWLPVSSRAVSPRMAVRGVGRKRAFYASPSPLAESYLESRRAHSLSPL